MKREDIKKAFEKADKMMKESNGHTYETVLKTRCIYCHRSPNQKGDCRAWFTRFLECLENVLLESN